jgi:hypothetical protein
VIAYQLLGGAYSGIVPNGVAGLRAGDIDRAGDSAIPLSYIKGRTGPESETCPRGRRGCWSNGCRAAGSPRGGNPMTRCSP